MAIYEDRGFDCIRSAGSRGAWDFVAIGPDGIVLVQVRHGRWPGPEERKRLAAYPAPANAARVIHRWRNRGKKPDVMVL